MLTKTIRVLDITDRVAASLTSTDWAKQAKATPKSTLPQQPWLTVTRIPHWWSRRFVVTPGEGASTLAEWRAGALSTSSNALTFAAGSPHCSHAITMTTKSYWKFQEQFVVDSASFTWAADSGLANLKFSLYKHYGPRALLVGRYEQSFKFLRTGGVLALDTREIDPVVGILTCLVVLLKRRQKEAERQNP
jgi:hypothetical protein